MMERAAWQEGLRFFRIEVGEDGVALLTLDEPGASVNTISLELGEELQRIWPSLQSDPKVQSILIASGKKDSFIAGAKLEMIQGLRSAEEGRELASMAQEVFNRIAQSAKPVVAAIDGSALGGGLELALACTRRMASASPKTKLGLPEIQLGLIPGAGGTQRLPRLVGIQQALDLILTGKQVDAKRALRMGLVHEVVPAELLLDVARRRARELGAGQAPGTRGGKRGKQVEALRTLALEDNPLGRKLLFRKARERALAKSRGHYPAIPAAIDAVETGVELGMEAGLAKEAACFGELAVSPVAAELIGIFFAQTALKKERWVDPSVEPKPIQSVGMVGAGLMGGGIAYVTASQAGIPVRFKERDDQALGRGFAAVRGILDERVRRRRISSMERDRVMGRITGGIDYEGFEGLDLVVEAVFEDLHLKHEILHEVEAHTKDDCIFASNTSTLPIGRIAEAAKRPQNVVGMHYFSPVHRMPLLEVIRGEKTAPWVLATAVALGKAQGKTVIVVNDGPGFYTTRILAPFMMEAAWMLTERAEIEALDEALVEWGFPVGPLTLLDEVGIDVGHKVSKTMVAAFGDRMVAPPVLERVVADRRLGRKNRRGFYRYGGKKKQVDGSMYRLLGTDGKKVALPTEEIQERLVLRMCNEAARCLEEGILQSPRDGDVGAVFGLGFPPFRGGPFRYMDALGAQEVVRRLRSYEERFGARFQPAGRLVEMGEKGQRFYP